MLETNIYKNLTRINKLFTDNNFHVYNKNKDPVLKIYNLSYSKSINRCDEYKLDININNSKIKITIPVKKGNISFNSEFSSLEDVYQFFKFHINIYINK